MFKRFFCQKVQKGSNWGKMWHLQFQWKFVATSVLHHNLAPLIFVSVSTFIFVKKADRQKNYTLEHVIMKIGFHMYQNWSNIWYKPSSLHFRRTSTSQTALTTMTPCIAAPENATVGTTSVDIWRWAFQLGGPIPMLLQEFLASPAYFLKRRCSSIHNSKGYHPFSPLLFLLRSP